MWPFSSKKKKQAKKEAEEKAKLEKQQQEKAKQEAKEPKKVEPAKTEPAKTETKKVESVKPEPKKTEAKAEPKQAEPKKEEVKKADKANVKAEQEEETVIVEDEKTRKAVYRVMFDKEDNEWKIKKDGAKRIIGSYKTKDEALTRVQELSKNQDSKFVVYKKDGKFQKKANLNLKSTNNDQND